MTSSSSPTRPSEAQQPQQPPTLAPVAPAGNEDQTKEIAPFLRSLRRMLDRESDAILCWTPDGRAFEIHDMEVMTSYILPKYFKHAKYTSFQRQLNYFNFRKWTKSRAVVCTFSNAFFVRDQPDLTWRITRKRGLSDAKSANNNSGSGTHATDGGASPSPRSPKPRASSTSGANSSTAAAGAASGAVPKPAALKRETSGSKRKATSTPTSARKVAKVAPVKPEALSSADASVESLEWVDTLYPSLEALEAECSVSASPAPVSPVASPLTNSDINITSIVVPAPTLGGSFQYNTPSLESGDSGAYSNYSSYDGSGSYYSEQVAYSWPQYSPSVEDGNRFRPAASYFAPTVVQTSCVAL